MIAMEEQLLTVEEVAKELRLKPTGVRKLLREGVIPAYKIAGNWLVKPSDLRAYIEAQKYKPEERKQ